MSSRESDTSFGWEKVSASEWDDSSFMSESSLDSEYNVKVNVSLRSTVGNQEKELEENSGMFEMSEKTIKPGRFSQNSTSRAHELSESENSSAELNTLSVCSRKPPKVVNSNAPSSSRNIGNDKLSSSESNESDCNSEETNSNNSKVSTDIREKKIDLVVSEYVLPEKSRDGILRQNNEVLNSKHYIPVKLEEELSIENIGDQEIWMVQCPLDLNPKKLLNKEFDFSGTSEFAVETENKEKVYTTTACTGRWKSLSCLLPSAERKQLEAVVVNAAGQIIITEKVMNSQLNSTVPARSNKMEFPEDLKVRHPLFGADYEKELDIRRQRLLVSSLKKRKKKKKERKEMPKDISYGTISEDQADNSVPSLSEDMEPQMDIAVTSKKTKKRRHSESFNTNSDHSDKDDTRKLEGKHLKKKLRKSLPSNSADESMEIEIPINQEYSKKKKKKKKKHAVQ